jgi:signal transduction histidine kinase
MSLRRHLFLLLGTLVALLVVAQWWMIHALSEELEEEVGVVALNVGRSMVAVFADAQAPVHQVQIQAMEHAMDRDEQQVHVLRLPEMEAGEDAAVTVEVRSESAQQEGERELKVVKRFNYTVAGAPGDTPEDLGDLNRRLEEHLQEVGVDHKVMVRLVKEDGEVETDTLVLEGPAGQRAIPIPSNPLEERLAHFRQRMLGGTLAILALGLLFAGVVAHRVSAPLRRLAGAARQVGEGELGAQVPDPGTGEVGTAIHAFNQMSHRLAVLEEDTRRLRGRQHLSELGEVARGLAHTLRNPLNALGLSVEEMAAEPVDGERRAQLAGSARRQIRRMDGAVRSILALASGGAGKPEPVAVGDLAQDVALEALQDAGRTTGQTGAKVRIEVDVAPGMEPLPAVVPELRAVLQALVVNAVEASPPGGRVTVQVRPAADRPGGVRVEVEDDGPGVAPEVRDRLFTPHVSTKPHGSGMGLFLAQRIAANRYDGTVAVEDRTGGGTRAVLEIGPRAAMTPDDEVADEH